jgi:hypothetical protein
MTLNGHFPYHFPTDISLQLQQQEHSNRQQLRCLRLEKPLLGQGGRAFRFWGTEM